MAYSHGSSKFWMAGTIQRSQLAQTSRRTFRLSKRLSASVLFSLYSFWLTQNAGLTPFAFYNQFDVVSGQQIGSNYDPTGNNVQGRVTVVFRSNWATGQIYQKEAHGTGTEHVAPDRTRHWIVMLTGAPLIHAAAT